MKARLNVTEAERLCYSRRKLQAISALRNAGINPTVYGRHKDYREPGVRGKVYLVEHPDGTMYHFTRLADVHVYVAEYQAFQRQRAVPDWHAWRKRFQKAEPPICMCAWDECPYQATTRAPDDTALCAGHAFIYECLLEARRKRSASQASQSPLTTTPLSGILFSDRTVWK